jgi:predicted DNA-binding protein (MmcQ/YjbR family)
MAFFLLKWVWNSVAEDGTVTKKSLVHQLQSNKELLAALNKQPAQLKSELDQFRTA